MDQAAKLEPFLLLSKNARGMAAADVVQKATSEPGIFAFGELMDVPGINQVSVKPSIANHSWRCQWPSIKSQTRKRKMNVLNTSCKVLSEVLASDTHILPMACVPGQAIFISVERFRTAG
jgi:hypothetical protein